MSAFRKTLRMYLMNDPLASQGSTENLRDEFFFYKKILEYFSEEAFLRIPSCDFFWITVLLLLLNLQEKYFLAKSSILTMLDSLKKVLHIMLHTGVKQRHASEHASFLK